MFHFRRHEAFVGTSWHKLKPSQIQVLRGDQASSSADNPGSLRSSRGTNTAAGSFRAQNPSASFPPCFSSKLLGARLTPLSRSLPRSEIKYLPFVREIELFPFAAPPYLLSCSVQKLNCPPLSKFRRGPEPRMWEIERERGTAGPTASKFSANALEIPSGDGANLYPTKLYVYDGCFDLSWVSSPSELGSIEPEDRRAPPSSLLARPLKLNVGKIPI